MKTLVLVMSVMFIASCATPYGKYGIAGGYTDSRFDENTFSISVDTNGFTDQNTTSQHAMYRAAELTVENGFDYFIIVTGGSKPTTGAMVMPSRATSNTWITGYGNTATARTTTTYSPTTVVPMVFPNASMTIKSLKGVKPEENPNAYDARAVMKYLGPQIGVEAAKK